MRFWQTIQFKLFTTFSLIFLLILLILSLINYRFSQQELVRTLETSAFHLSESVKNSLDMAMLSGNRQLIQSHVERIAAGSHILSLLIADKNGVIRAANDRQKLGQQFTIETDFCQFCHRAPISQTKNSAIVSRKNAGKLLRTGIAINNKPECYSCHPSEDKILGVMMLEYSMTHYESEFRKFNRKIALSFLGLVVVLSLLSIFFIHNLVIKKVKALVRKIQAIAAGKYFEESLKFEHDEFGLLAQSIDKMEKEVQQSFMKLDENRRYFQKIIDNIHDGLIVLDRDQRVLLVNQQLSQSAQIRKEEIVGKKCYQFFHDIFCCAISQEECCPSLEVFEKGEFVRKKMEVNCNGEKKILEISSYPLIIRDQQVEQCIEIFHDITKQDKLEREIRQSEKMAAIGRLASGIAHEINNPLATIATCVEGINSRINDNFQKDDSKNFLSEYLHRMNQSVYRCKNIIDKLLIFSKPTTNSRLDFDLNEVVLETISVVQLRAQHEHKKIDFQKWPKKIIINGDPNQIGQVLMNVLINSLDAIPQESIVLVKTEIDQSEALIYIVDKGIGIEAKNLPFIFDPFFTTKSPGKGTGLGLSISRQIVEDHGGSISVNSEVRKGTEVIIRLPLKS